MTDNEKASTFIGWKPEPVRTGVGENTMVLPCPDMADPRNYMRALERLDQGWCLTAIECSISTFEGEPPRLVLDIHKQGPNRVLEALATLYDAEHPEV